MIRVAINGFGRIGRNTLKAGWKNKDIHFVALNDLTDTRTLAHLLQYDSVYGKWSENVHFDPTHLLIGKKKIAVFSQRNPEQLPWKRLQVDVVLECTGLFKTKELASAHRKAGARRVIISAPVQEGNVPTFIVGVNADASIGEDTIINMASCTTNCIAPIAEILHRHFTVQKAMMTTIHGYTASQHLQDSPDKDLRRARAAALNIIPTTTGAAIATTQALPELKGKFDGFAMRVPVAVGSIADCTFLLALQTTVEEINAVFVKEAKSPRYKGVLSTTDAPLVSSDIILDPHSSIVDLSFTQVCGGDLVKVVSWYDNEWGYSKRLVELTLLVGKRIHGAKGEGSL